MQLQCVCARARVCVCVCVRACVRACARACVRACVRPDEVMNRYDGKYINDTLVARVGPQRPVAQLHLTSLPYACAYPLPAPAAAAGRRAHMPSRIIRCTFFFDRTGNILPDGPAVVHARTPEKQTNGKGTAHAERRPTCSAL